MVTDNGIYDITQFQFDDNSADLVDRTHRRLCARFAHTNVCRDDLYYVAASAVECLLNRRADYLAALADGMPAETCAAGAQIGRADPHFYFRLARQWADERRSDTALTAPAAFRLAS